MKTIKRIQEFFLFCFIIIFMMVLFPSFSGGNFSWNLDSFEISFEDALSRIETNSYFFPNNLSLATIDKIDNQVFFIDGIEAFSSEGFFITKSESLENFFIWQILKKESQSLLLGDYKSKGLPFFIDNRLFQISENNTNLKEITLSGKAGSIIWDRQLTSSLLTISANKDLVIIGLSSGVVWVLNAQGDLIFSVNLNQEEDSLISAVNVFSYQKKDYFVICQDIISSKKGPYSQWHLYEKIGKNQWDHKSSYYMGNLLHRERKVIFDNKGHLFLETSKGTDIYDFNTSNLHHLSFEGILINGTYTNSDKGILVTYDFEKDNLTISHFIGHEYLHKKVLKISSGSIISWSIKKDENLFHIVDRPYLWRIQIGLL